MYRTKYIIEEYTKYIANSPQGVPSSLGYRAFKQNAKMFYSDDFIIYMCSTVRSFSDHVLNLKQYTSLSPEFGYIPELLKLKG